MEPLKNRYCSPTKYDCAPYGAVWVAKVDDNIIDVFVQVSEDASIPHWIKAGVFLEKAFENFFMREDFMEECLRLYKKNCNKDQQVIINIINKSTETNKPQCA